MLDHAGTVSYQKVGGCVQKGATRCQAASSRFLKTSTDGADTTSNGSLFQGSTTRAENVLCRRRVLEYCCWSLNPSLRIPGLSELCSR